MTRRRSFKRLVRARMERTGEGYAAARAVVLAAGERTDGAPSPLATTDERIRERTGRGWEEWFDLLDDRGAAGWPHRDIARHVAETLGIAPLAWNAQAIAVSYERARGLRVAGERADGFAVSVQRTVAVPAARLYEAVVDASLRPAWLPDGDLRPRTATPPRSARFDHGEAGGRVLVTVLPRGEGRSTVAVEHGRLADADEADRMRAMWREGLDALRALLEGAGT